MNWEYSLAGLLVGGFVGVTGMGGGSLVAPLLIVVFGVRALPAVGSGLLFAAATQAVGYVQHARLRSVDYRTALHLALGSVPASIAGAWTFARLIGSDSGVEAWLKSVVGIVLLLVAVTLLARPWLRGRERTAPVARPSEGLLRGGGVVVGLMTGITSIGSGSLTTALLSITTSERGQRVVGTVVFHAMLLTVAAGATHFAIGEVNLVLTAWLLLGSIPGVVIGSRLTPHIPEVQFRGGLGLALLALALLMLIPAGGRTSPTAEAREVERADTTLTVTPTHDPRAEPRGITALLAQARSTDLVNPGRRAP